MLHLQPGHPTPSQHHQEERLIGLGTLQAEQLLQSWAQQDDEQP